MTKKHLLQSVWSTITEITYVGGLSIGIKELVQMVGEDFLISSADFAGTTAVILLGVRGHMFYKQWREKHQIKENSKMYSQLRLNDAYVQAKKEVRLLDST